ncbi:transmembrane protein 198 isoform 3-T3 [Morphnus guianensis]
MRLFPRSLPSHPDSKGLEWVFWWLGAEWWASPSDTCRWCLHLPSLSLTSWGGCRGAVLPASHGAGAEILRPLPGVPRAMTATVQTLRFKLLPHEPGQEWGHSCQQEIERRYQVVPSVVCAMCCLFGIIYCFFGYRCFKAVMFLTGLMFGSIIIFMLCYKERVLDTQLSVEASVGIGLGIGVLCGLVTMLVRSVGLFMVGLLLGLLLAVATLVVMEQFYHPPTVWIPIALLLGVGMLFAVLTLQWQRFFTTLSTAVFGSAIMTVTVDYFIELFLLVQYIYERIKVAPARPVCWYSWVILGVWPLLTVLGVLVQWKVTAEGYSHTEGVWGLGEMDVAQGGCRSWGAWGPGWRFLAPGLHAQIRGLGLYGGTALRGRLGSTKLGLVWFWGWFGCAPQRSQAPLPCSDHQPAAAPRAADAHQAAGGPKGEEEEAETPPPAAPPAQSPPARARLPPQAQPCAPLRWGRALP